MNFDVRPINDQTDMYNAALILAESFCVRDNPTDTIASHLDRLHQSIISIGAFTTGRTLIGVGVIAACEHPEAIELKYIGVKEGYKSEGVGSRILTSVDDFASQRGSRVVRLFSTKTNGNGLYLANGYRPVDPMVDPNAWGIDMVKVIKQLTSV